MDCAPTRTKARADGRRVRATTARVTVADDLSNVDDEWKAELRRALAEHLGISAWRVFVVYVRAGSVEVGVRIIDADGMGN